MASEQLSVVSEEDATAIASVAMAYYEAKLPLKQVHWLPKGLQRRLKDFQRLLNGFQRRMNDR